jgi:hypothetical protein
MPLKRPRRRSPTKPRTAGNINERVVRLEATVHHLTRSHVNVRREEHEAVLVALQKVEQHAHDLEVQFKRIAQLQADLDAIKQAWAKMNPDA